MLNVRVLVVAVDQVGRCAKPAGEPTRHLRAMFVVGVHIPATADRHHADVTTPHRLDDVLPQCRGEAFRSDHDANIDVQDHVGPK